MVGGGGGGERRGHFHRRRNQEIQDGGCVRSATYSECYSYISHDLITLICRYQSALEVTFLPPPLPPNCPPLPTPQGQEARVNIIFIRNNKAIKFMNMCNPTNSTIAASKITTFESCMALYLNALGQIKTKLMSLLFTFHFR